MEIRALVTNWDKLDIRYFQVPITHLVYPTPTLRFAKALFQISLRIYNPLIRTWKQYLCKILGGKQGVLCLMWKYESSEYRNYVTCLAEGELQKSAQFRDDIFCSWINDDNVMRTYFSWKLKLFTDNVLKKIDLSSSKMWNNISLCEFTHGNCTLWPYDLNFESWMMQVIKCIEGIIHIFKAG